MKSVQSSTSLITKAFSHIYIEREAENYPTTILVKSILKDSTIIMIEHYKDVFCVSGQDFMLQKKSPKLILAVKRSKYYYKGSPLCNNYGFEHFYYASSVMNCPFNCAYCYLQGMYPSANIVIFVNINDTLNSIKGLSQLNPYVSVSYDTDLLALEKLTGFVGEWIKFCYENKDITVEVRTKSADFSLLTPYKPPENLILAVTLSPDEIILNYEDKTPKLSSRINFIKRAIEYGYTPRICIDPVLYVENYTELYTRLVSYIFLNIDAKKISDVSFGMIRLPKDFLKRCEKRGLYSKIFAYPFRTETGALTLIHEHEVILYNLLLKTLSGFLPANKINYYSL